MISSLSSVKQHNKMTGQKCHYHSTNPWMRGLNNAVVHSGSSLITDADLDIDYFDDSCLSHVPLKIKPNLKASIEIIHSRPCFLTLRLWNSPLWIHV